MQGDRGWLWTLTEAALLALATQEFLRHPKFRAVSARTGDRARAASVPACGAG